MTLVELAFGLALAAVLVSLAAPGMQAVARATAMHTATFELLSGVQQARARSIVEGRPAVLCPAGPDGNCAAARAAVSGWQAFLDIDGRRESIRARNLPAGIHVHASRSPLRFWPAALASGTGTLTICDASGRAPPRAIVISRSGRARLESPAPGACPP